MGMLELRSEITPSPGWAVLIEQDFVEQDLDLDLDLDLDQAQAQGQEQGQAQGQDQAFVRENVEGGEPHGSMMNTPVSWHHSIYQDTSPSIEMSMGRSVCSGSYGSCGEEDWGWNQDQDQDQDQAIWHEVEADTAGCDSNGSVIEAGDGKGSVRRDHSGTPDTMDAIGDMLEEELDLELQRNANRKPGNAGVASPCPTFGTSTHTISNWGSEEEGSDQDQDQDQDQHQNQAQTQAQNQGQNQNHLSSWCRGGAWGEDQDQDQDQHRDKNQDQVRKKDREGAGAPLDEAGEVDEEKIEAVDQDQDQDQDKDQSRSRFAAADCSFEAGSTPSPLASPDGEAIMDGEELGHEEMSFVDPELTVQVEECDISWKRGELIGKGAFGKVYLALNQA